MAERRSMEYFRDYHALPAVLQRFRSGDVLIWSKEHGAYWRPGGCGYTTHVEAAGRYSLDDALLNTRHCGPEKRIVFERASLRPLRDEADQGGERA